MIRVAVAIVAGFLLWSALFLGGNQAIVAVAPADLSEAAVVADPLVLGILVGLSLLCSIIAGATTARLARGSALKAAVALAAILLAVGIGVQASAWDTLPLWYHLSFLALLAPGVLVGAAIGRGPATLRDP